MTLQNPAEMVGDSALPLRDTEDHDTQPRVSVPCASIPARDIPARCVHPAYYSWAKKCEGCRLGPLSPNLPDPKIRGLESPDD